MKPNYYDSVLGKVEDIVGKVSDKISVNFKNVKPFDKEPIKTAELLPYYDSLNQDDMLFLIQKHGEEAVNQFISEMETYRQRYRQGVQ